MTTKKEDKEMDLMETIKDAIVYPINNIKALIIYLLLGLLIGIVAIFTGLGAVMSLNFSSFSIGALSIIGIIIILCLFLLLLGFSLDIVNFGIELHEDAPGIDLARQIINGLKYIIVAIVYMIIPTIITVILMYISKDVGIIVGLILSIIFAFVLYMGICRLAKTDSLSHALDIPGAIGDLTEIGVFKVIITIIIAELVGLIIVFLLTLVLSIIFGIISKDLLLTIVPIIAAVLDAWLLFYSNRVMGLLYSNK